MASIEHRNKQVEKLRIIVGGYIGLYPTGGATWDYIQYPLGLRLLGHDVYYIEDTMQYPVFQAEGYMWDDATACVTYLSEIMDRFGFEGKWAYRDVASEKSFGMNESAILEICSSADVFINISCSTYLRDEYLKIPKRVLIDSDPMFTQIQYALEMDSDLTSANWSTRQQLLGHNYLFTFGENIGALDCKIPKFDLTWRTTRQPICIDQWTSQRPHAGGAFTTVMNWSGREKLLYENMQWGQKDVEFEKFKQVPAMLSDMDFEVVVNKPLNKESRFNAAELEGLGWRVKTPDSTVRNVIDYRNFILASNGEFSVAKETYVKSNSGWFSCRSACYLAAGRPVVTQETGWSRYIPSGDGLFAFTDVESAVTGLKSVGADFDHHSRAASDIAREYFDSEVVLSEMLGQLN